MDVVPEPAQLSRTVSPGLVYETPDYEELEVIDEEGNITKEWQPTGTSTKSVKYSILYVKAVKALQEAMNRIEALEVEVQSQNINYTVQNLHLVYT